MTVFGRTGDVNLGATDDITVRNITGVGATFTGVVTYEDVTNVDSIGVITARSGIQGIGIQSAGVNVAVGVITALNFIGAGNTFAVSGTTVDISIAGGGGPGMLRAFGRPVRHFLFYTLIGLRVVYRTYPLHFNVRFQWRQFMNVMTISDIM